MGGGWGENFKKKKKLSIHYTFRGRNWSAARMFELEVTSVKSALGMETFTSVCYSYSTQNL